MQNLRKINTRFEDSKSVQISFCSTGLKSVLLVEYRKTEQKWNVFLAWCNYLDLSKIRLRLAEQ